jgi:hypothetical protein
MMPGRFRVQYAHYDGNVYDVGAYATLPEALDAAQTVRDTRRVPAVFVTDDDDPERGQLTDLDLPED